MRILERFTEKRRRRTVRYTRAKVPTGSKDPIRPRNTINKALFLAATTGTIPIQRTKSLKPPKPNTTAIFYLERRIPMSHTIKNSNG